MPNTELEPLKSPTARREESWLSLAGHLEELRRRLGVCLAAFVLAGGASLAWMEALIGWLSRPAEPYLVTFAFFSPTEPLVAYVKVAGLAGLAGAMPVLLWQAWAFASPGLRPEERRHGAAFIGWGSALFVLGVAFAYTALLPASLRVLLGLAGRWFEPVLSIDQYLGFVTSLAFWCGVIFELPLVIVVLSRVGIVTPAWLQQQRPYAVLVIVIAAAILTPTTDVLSLLLMVVPIVVLYEVSIVVAHLTRRKPSGGST